MAETSDAARLLALPAPLALTVRRPNDRDVIEEEKAGDDAWHHGKSQREDAADAADARASRASDGLAKAPTKTEQHISQPSSVKKSRAAVANGDDAGADDDGDGDDDDNARAGAASASGKRRVSPRSRQVLRSPSASASSSNAASSSVAMRSPSRLAASFLVGRDRMARAARAWRDGARRAGLFGGDDDDEEEEEYYEEGEDEEEKQEEGVNRDERNDRRSWSEGVGEVESKRGPVLDAAARQSEATSRQAEERPQSEPNPADDEPENDNEPQSLAPLAAASLPHRVPRLVPSRLAPATRLPKMANVWACLDRIECILIRDVFITEDDDDDSGPTVFYVLDVYNYQEQHSLPTHRYYATHGPRTTSTSTTTTTLALGRRAVASLCTPPASPSRAPDYQISHRFSSFLKLRNSLFKATQRKHPRGAPPHEGSEDARPPSSSHRQCAYCQKLALFLASGSDAAAPLGWKAKFFTTVEMRKTLLSQFVAELVAIAREQRHACSNLRTLARLAQPSSRHVHRSVPGMLQRFLTVQTGENFMR